MVEVAVCIGTACHIKGSYNIVHTFQQMIEEKSLHDKIDLKANLCMRQCGNNNVTVSVNNELFDVDPITARKFFEEKIMILVK